MHKPRGPPNRLSQASIVAFHTAIATYHLPARRQADRERLLVHIRSWAERVGCDDHSRSDKHRPAAQKRKVRGSAALMIHRSKRAICAHEPIGMEMRSGCPKTLLNMMTEKNSPRSPKPPKNGEQKLRGCVGHRNKTCTGNSDGWSKPKQEEKLCQGSRQCDFESVAWETPGSSITYCCSRCRK